METKLTIDFSTKKLEVAGSEAFVEKIYFDFKDQISKLEFSNNQPAENEKGETTNTQVSPKVVKKSKIKSKAKSSAQDVGIDRDLDCSGIQEYFDRFDVKTDAERALVFYKFLIDDKNLPDVSQIALKTCFFALKDNLNQPNIVSLLANDSTRTMYLKRDAGLVRITTFGENHFNLKLNKQ